MNRLRRIILLQFATTFALAQAAHQGNQPDALVRSLYTQVIARQPKDLLNTTDMKVFAPYLSHALLHKMDLARACAVDWTRHDPEPHLKPISNYDVFTGDYAYVAPRKFSIDSSQPDKDGSFRVVVSLTNGGPRSRAWNWRVAPIIVRENGHFAVDNVIYLDDAIWDNEADRRNTTLSQYLAAGCDGAHWIGPSLPNQANDFVRSLYTQVLARRPGGIPSGTNWKIFAPYMSKALLHRIDVFLACEQDWEHKTAKSKASLKSPFGIWESGLLTGGDEKTEPRTFHIDRTERQNNGSVRAYITLTRPEDKWTWNVVDILAYENGRYVVDDVIFLKDHPQESDYTLSQALSSGCFGGRWVSFRNH